jgi:hypothetical protein
LHNFIFHIFLSRIHHRYLIFPLDRPAETENHRFLQRLNGFIGNPLTWRAVGLFIASPWQRLNFSLHAILSHSKNKKKSVQIRIPGNQANMTRAG